MLSVAAISSGCNDPPEEPVNPNTPQNPFNLGQDEEGIHR